MLTPGFLIAFEICFVYFFFPETAGRTLEELAFRMLKPPFPHPAGIYDPVTLTTMDNQFSRTGRRPRPPLRQSRRSSATRTCLLARPILPRRRATKRLRPTRTSAPKSRRVNVTKSYENTVEDLFFALGKAEEIGGYASYRVARWICVCTYTIAPSRSLWNMI